MPPPAPSDALVFHSSMRRFTWLCVALLPVEAPLIFKALVAAQELPTKGDPTLRYVSIGVPALWASIIPLILLFIYLGNRGQTLSITSKNITLRRGSLSSIVQYAGTVYQPSGEKRFDQQLTLTTKSRVVVIRSFFFPEFEAIEQEIAARFNRPQEGDYNLRSARHRA